MEFINSISTFDISFSMLPILMLIEYWLLFEKAGVEGWKALIPVYGDYIKFKIAKKENLFWWFLGVTIGFVFVLSAATMYSLVSATSFGFDAGAMFGTMVLWFLTFAAMGAMVAFEVILGINLAKVFGKSTAFGVGNFILEPIFIGVMALSNEIKYVGDEEKKEEVKAEESATPIVEDIVE